MGSEAHLESTITQGILEKQGFNEREAVCRFYLVEVVFNTIIMLTAKDGVCR